MKKESITATIGGLLVILGIFAVIIAIPVEMTVAGLPLGLVADVIGFTMIAVGIVFFGASMPNLGGI